MDIEIARRACRNILARIKCTEGEEVLVLFDEEKAALAEVMREQALAIGSHPYALRLPPPAEGKYAGWLTRLLSVIVRSEFVVVLLGRAMFKARGIMEVIGRPDKGIGEVSSRFFCDWAISPDSLIRLYSADPGQVERYGDTLLRELGKGKQVRVTTDAGTDVTLQTTHWLSGDGEVFTPPVPGSAIGVVVFDASVYWTRPESQIKVTLEAGRIMAVDCALPASEQYQMFLADSKKDEGASVLAEFGIGVNPNADPHGDIMEAEQAQGTCHFGFGNNIPFGGSNASCIHYDAVMGRPTISANGHVIMSKGKLVSREDEL